MSAIITAEAPFVASPAPGLAQSLAHGLDAGFKAGEAAARALRLQSIKARLNAMRLAPVPATPREAMARAREAAELAREAGVAAPATGDLAASETAGDIRRLARLAVARSRRGVRPGSPEDRMLQSLELGLADGTAAVEVIA